MNTDIISFNLPSSVPFSIQIHRINHVHKHWHKKLEILFVLKGTVEVQVRDTVSQLSEGDLLLINSNEIHALNSPDCGLALNLQLDLLKLHLSPNEAQDLYFLCDSSQDTDSTRYDNLRNLLALIVERNSIQDAATRFDNQSFAYSILKELSRSFLAPPSYPRPKEDKHLERMDQIVRYIDAHYRENLRLADLAQVMHLTTPYLSSLFSKYLGITFTDFYGSVRMGYAIQDLVSTQDSIDDIALKHGFANAQAFSRSFRSTYGILPSVYRRQQQERHRSASGGIDSGGGIPFDLSALTRYLPSHSPETPENASSLFSCTGIYADWQTVTGQLGDTWHKLIGIGSAKQILFREVQDQLAEIQRCIGFTHIKFHGIFSDEMMVVSRTVTGALKFNFRTVDMVLDFLFSIHLTPFLELSFMPTELAKDRQKTVLSNHYNTSQPAHLEEWFALVEAFFLHLMERYGRKTVESMPVTVWNNADSSTEMYGMQEELVFQQLYQGTYLTIKQIDPLIQIGGPALTFMEEKSVSWARQFYRWQLDHNIMPDFFSVQYYAVDNRPSRDVKIDLRSLQPNHLVAVRSDAHLSLLAGTPLSTDPDYLQQFRGQVEQFRAELGLEQLPLWITEWNLTVNHNNLICDTLFAGCYVLKNVLEHSQGLQSLAYWCATDFIEEQPLSAQIFHGGLGLLTVEGIPKPQFLAYQALRQLKPNILSQGPGYIVTRTETTLSVLLYHYQHFNDIYAGNKTYNVSQTNRYTPFPRQSKVKFTLQLTHLPNRPVLEAVEFIVNHEQGSAFDNWLKMGAPTFGRSPALDRYRLECLKASAHPLIHSFDPKLEQNVFTYEAALEPLEFRLIQLSFQ